MALSKQLELYLRLERIMIELDDRDDPYAENIRDLMDPLWYELSGEDHAFLNSRGEIDIRVLYPITLSVPDLFQVPPMEQHPGLEILPQNGVGKRFDLEGVISCAA